MVLRGRGVEWGGWYLKVSESMGHVKRMVKVENWILVYIHYLGNKLLRRAIGQLHNQRFFLCKLKGCILTLKFQIIYFCCVMELLHSNIFV